MSIQRKNKNGGFIIFVYYQNETIRFDNITRFRVEATSGGVPVLMLEVDGEIVGYFTNPNFRVF